MMKNSVLYLDYNASTPCAAEVVDAMLPYFGDDYANPSSTHVAGCRAMRVVEKARSEIARAYGADPGEIVFTSGATESNCMIIHGVAAYASTRRRILIGAGEHKSVLGPCGHLEEQGFEVVRIPLDKAGLTSIQDAERLVNEDTLLVSVQGANNETGVLQPIEAIAEIAHSRGALVHCDAAQMPGKVSVCFDGLGCDYASFSAHKVYGPKGIGACYVRRGHARAALAPLLRGGGQEGELRSGTLNVPAIVGFGVASALASSRLGEDRSHVGAVRNHFESRLLELLPCTVVVGNSAERIPGTSCVIFANVPADVVLARATDLCISSGSACNSGTVSPSHVILACGYSRDEARCMVRVSFGRNSRLPDAELAASRLCECVTSIRGDLKRQLDSKAARTGEHVHDS
jgi:cysteine desulfurase